MMLPATDDIAARLGALLTYDASSPLIFSRTLLYFTSSIGVFLYFLLRLGIFGFALVSILIYFRAFEK